MTELTSSKRVVGVKQSRRAIQDGRAARVFLACDADPALTEPLRDACREHGIPVESDCTMAQLGQACRITVGASVAVVLR
jgi:large subunit ribosomal protein L7A